MTPAPTQRRADIDWIRIAAFGVLILYHVGLVYAPWDWHVRSPHTIEALGLAALVTNPWRLTLLFMVSGIALRFMVRKTPPAQAFRQRLERLVPPLLFGVLILVPPQSWIEAMEKGSFSGDLWTWWLSEFSPAGLRDGVPLNHVWFVLYITVYSLAALVLARSSRLFDRLEAGLGRLLAGGRLLVVPIIYLALLRLLVFPWAGLTNHITDDPYNHAMSLGVFLTGFLLALREDVWTRFERMRWTSLAVAAISLPALILLSQPVDQQPAAPANLVFAINQWATICAVLGFGSRLLRGADGPVLRYLTDAVFPCYLAHQTLLVIAAHILKPHGLPVGIEASLLVLITLGGSLAVYEVVRRIGVLRPLWGLRPVPRST
ncbi:MAG: acyltransferase family protein [Phenylobacterium sp.]